MKNRSEFIINLQSKSVAIVLLTRMFKGASLGVQQLERYKATTYGSDSYYVVKIGPDDLPSIGGRAMNNWDSSNEFAGSTSTNSYVKCYIPHNMRTSSIQVRGMGTKCLTSTGRVGTWEMIKKHVYFKKPYILKFKTGFNVYGYLLIFYPLFLLLFSITKIVSIIVPSLKDDLVFRLFYII